MTISLSKRSFLKGLFVAPAIVAATNIMPIKAMGLILPEQRLSPGVSTLITDLSEIQSASQLANEWGLYDLGNGNRRWMTPYSAETFRYHITKIRSMEVPQTGKEIDTTVALMKAEPGSAVIWGLTPDMMTYRRA